MHLLADNFDQHPLPSPAVELPVENPLPGAKIKPAVGHRDHHLATHDLALQVRIGVVLTGSVVPILVNRRMRRQPFELDLVIVMQAALIIVNEHTRSNVLRIYKGQSPLYHIPLSYH